MDNNIIDKRSKGEWKAVDMVKPSEPFYKAVWVQTDKRLIAVLEPNGHHYEETKANAAFIVTACNEYYKLKEDNKRLLEALKEIKNQFEKVVQPKYTLDNMIIHSAEEAIKQSELS